MGCSDLFLEIGNPIQHGMLVALLFTITARQTRTVTLGALAVIKSISRLRTPSRCLKLNSSKSQIKQHLTQILLAEDCGMAEM
jgi:hypothetical protein